MEERSCVRQPCTERYQRVSIPPPVIHRFDSLLNLMYLCDLEADNPAKVREYMRQAQTHLDALIEIQGLRGRKQEDGDGRRMS
jgi:hypothetical protein